MKNFLCALGLALTLGCASAIVRPYVGEQQAWPTANGSIVNIRYDLPVFTSLPPSPYEVIAELRISSPLFAQPEESHLSVLAKKGIELGGDALVFVDGQVYFGTSYGLRANAAPTEGKQATVTQVNRFNPESFRQGVNVIAIRWIGDPPPGLPARYAKYSDKMLPAEPAPEAPAAAPAPAPTPAEAPAAPAPVAPAAPEPPKAEAPAAPAVPVAPEPPKAEAPAAPATPETPKVETPAPAAGN